MGYQGEVRGVQGTVERCGSSAHRVMGRVIGSNGSNVRKFTSKGCGSCGDGVAG